MCVSAGVTTVGGVHAARASSSPAPPGGALALQSELQRVIAALPEAWRTQRPAGQPEWWVMDGSDGGPAMCLRHAGGTSAVAFVVEPSRRLCRQGEVAWPPPHPHRRCLVVAVAPPRLCSGLQQQPHGQPQQAGQLQQRQPQEQGQRGQPEVLYLVGALDGGPLTPAYMDPTMWAVAQQPVLASTARGRALAHVQQQAAGAGVGFTYGLALRPAVWRDGQRDGLGEMQRRWAASVEPSLSGRRRGREETESAGMDEMLRATAWMRRSQPRLSPAQRAEGRQQQSEASQQGQQPGASRSVWWERLESVLQPEGSARSRAARGSQGSAGAAATASAEQSALVWAAVWRRARRTPAPREHRFVAWQVLHGCLPCAAWEAHVAAQPGPSAGGCASAAVCHAPACAAAGCPETLSHVFLECPGAAAVAAWVSQLWGAMVQGPGPPCTPQVFLADDSAVWDPGPGQLRVLWGLIRMAFLFFVWSARCGCRARAADIQPARVAARIVAYLRVRMQQDFARMHDQSGAFAALSGQWMPARQPLAAEVVRARWCHNDVLASQAGEGASPAFVVRLSTAGPVPLPS